MESSHRWSLVLMGRRSRRMRWLTETGQFSSDPAKALRLSDPDLAAQRVQAFMALRGWDVTVMERFQLVPAPEKAEIRITYARQHQLRSSKSASDIPGITSARGTTSPKVAAIHQTSAAA